VPTVDRGIGLLSAYCPSEADVPSDQE